jgi:predicted nucleic acid-binding protein
MYVDTSAIIYAVERVEPYLTASRPLWDALTAGTLAVVTSQMALLEVLVKPIQNGDQQLATRYRHILLTATGLDCRPIDLTILEQAAVLRATHGLKTPDAIHAATALEAACAMFVTNDPGFRRVPGLNVVVLDEVVTS